MSFTSNKKYITQAPSDLNWGVALNDQMITYADLNVGGTYSLDVSLPSGVSPNGTFSLTSPNSRNGILVLSGNPSYALWPTITITIGEVAPNYDFTGFLFVQNKITLNGSAYPQIRIKNYANATYAVIPPNTQVTLISDATNGVRIAGQYEGFVSGTSLTFTQTAAPTGWTKSTTHDNKALRIVNSAGGTSGGTTAFTSVFAARTLTSANLPDHGVTITDPGHNHTLSWSNGGNPIVYGSSVDNLNASSGTAMGGAKPTVNSKTTGITAAFGSAARGGAQTSIDFAVQYVDAIICTKD